jgi:exportin-1
MANKILNEFKLLPDSWLCCDMILNKAQSMYTKIIALGILEDVIKTKWLLLPEDQRLGIRNFLVDMLIKNVTDDNSFNNNSHFINKLNYIIVIVSF